MIQFINDLLSYLKAVFLETWQKAFTFFDVLGIVLFFYPKLANSLISDEFLARVVGGLIFFISFLLANFSLYRGLTEYTSYQADIRLEVLESSFSHSHGTRNPPFREASKSPTGFNKQGLPDLGSLWVNLRIVNIGYEKGHLVWELDESKTKLPSLFNLDRVNIEFHSPMSVADRSTTKTRLLLDVLFAEQDPHTFAQALKALVRSKQHYQVVLRYRTRRVDGESKTRKLRIRGDFQGLHRGVLKYWEERGFQDLADLARIT